MNQLSLLPLQIRTYNSTIEKQALEIYSLISNAILADKNYIEYNKFIYAPNKIILLQKGYIFENNLIYWNDYTPAANS